MELDPQDFASHLPDNFWEVWKFQLGTTGTNVIAMPKGSRLLYVGEQQQRVTVWALVRTKNPIVQRKIYVTGTGFPMEHLPKIYVGTVQVGKDLGPLVWHVFDEGEA